MTKEEIKIHYAALRENAFIHDVSMLDVAGRAGCARSVYRWRNGKLPNRYSLARMQAALQDLRSKTARKKCVTCGLTKIMPEIAHTCKSCCRKRLTWERSEVIT